jgi:hypothetical protein
MVLVLSSGPRAHPKPLILRVIARHVKQGVACADGSINSPTVDAACSQKDSSREGALRIAASFGKNKMYRRGHQQ